MWTPKQVEAFKLLSDPKIQQAALLGGSGSGKTYVIGHKFWQRAWEFPGCLQIILRKTMADCRDTVWSTMMIAKVLAYDIKMKNCIEYKQPAKVVYKNGSEIRIGGLHPSEIDKVLGPDYATIWPNEASEVSWKNIPALRTRLRDQSKHYEHKRPVKPMIVCDFNPPTILHWTHAAYIRKIDPETQMPLSDADGWGWLRMNPYDNRVNLSAQYISTLESMSERDKQRFLYGEFGQLKGLVYDNFNPASHIYDELPMFKGDWYRTIDFGFTNPFACYWAKYDHANECLYIDDEWYHSNITINDHAVRIKERTDGRAFAASVADHDAGDRAVLDQAGIYTIPAVKDVASGINVVYDLFNRGKLRINRRCVNLINELYAYQWKEGSQKTEPIKANDHACFTADTIIELDKSQVLCIVKTGVKYVYDFMGSRVTKDHPYLTQRGMVRLDALRYDDRIVICKKLLWTEFHLDGTQSQTSLSCGAILCLLRVNLQAIKQNACTGIYGKSIMVKYLKVCMSTTSMATRLITRLAISKLSHLWNTLKSIIPTTCQSGAKTWTSQEYQPLNGIRAKQAGIYISDLVNCHGLINNGIPPNASNAAEIIQHHSQNEASSAGIIARLPRSGPEDVYSIATTKGYYMAGGVVVSNCDAIRYLCMAISMPPAKPQFFSAK